MIAIKLNAGNDRNGNPRRVFVVIDELGYVVDAIDEGYNGISELWKKCPAMNKASFPAEFPTTVSEYKALLNKFLYKKQS